MKSRFHSVGAAIAAIVLSFFACTSPENEAQVFGLNTINTFYHGDLTAVKENADSTSVDLLNRLFPGDTLIFATKYRLTSLAVENLSREDRMVILLGRETQGISDTIALSIQASDNMYRCVIDEQTLRKWLKFEPRICTQIGEYFLEQRHDKKTAVQWLMQASIQGEPEAKYRLGLVYRYSLDFSEAIGLFEEAYRQGYTRALIELASTYAMSGNRDEAIHILKREAAKDNTDAMVALGQFYDAPSPPSDATPSSSYNWYKKAAEKGNSNGMLFLGQLFERESYYDSAFYWYTKSASLGNDLSMRRLADFYIEGRYVEKDFTKGWDWLQKAAEINKASAYFDMGDIFYYGKGVRADKRKALQYYKEAARNGSMVAGRKAEKLEKELGQ